MIFGRRRFGRSRVLGHSIVARVRAPVDFDALRASDDSIELVDGLGDQGDSTLRVKPSEAGSIMRHMPQEAETSAKKEDSSKDRILIRLLKK